MIASAAGTTLASQRRWQELQRQLAVAFQATPAAPSAGADPAQPAPSSWLGRARIRAAADNGRGGPNALS